MYSAVGSESAFRDGVFSQAAPAQGYQHSVREYADGSLGVLNDAAYRDGSLGDWRNDAAYHDGSLGATTRLLRPPSGGLRRRFGFRGVGALPGSALAPQLPVPLTTLQRRSLLAALRRHTLQPKQRAVHGFGADAVVPPTVATSSGPNWPLLIGGGAAIVVAAVVMMSGKKKR